MSNDPNNEKNTELQERIKSIKNISYLAYNREIIICTAVFACIFILVLSIVIKQLLIVVSVSVAVLLLSITITALYLYFNKQYSIEYDSGKNILVVGGFRRFRKYYINDLCYIIKDGQACEVTAKKPDSIDLLFSEMEKAEIIKTVHGYKEFFQIKQKEEDPITVGLGGGAPLKYGTMTFINGKFKTSYYVSTSKSIHIHFTIIKDDIKYNVIIPQSILYLLDKDTYDK